MSCWKLDVPNTFKPSERDFYLPNKLLVGAGPTNCSPRVLAALSKCTLTPICKEFYGMLADIKSMLQYVFQTKNETTIALQNSGTGGLEAAVTNLVDPGETIIVASGGVWGDRTIEKALIRGVNVIQMKCKPREVFTLDELEKEMIKHKPVALFITHGESSAGTTQPLEGLGDICHKYNCLLVVDAIVSLGGVPFFTDRWGIDVAISASQKAIGAPAGMAFLTVSPRAEERIKSRKSPPPFYYNIVDLANVWKSTKAGRRYHYTYNSHMICVVREALREIVEEGLENRWERHRKAAERFWEGIEKMGLKHFIAKPEHRLWTVNIIYTPDKLNWLELVDYMSDKYQVSIAFGIGPSQNLALRIGTMGYNAKPEVVDYVLKVLEESIEACRHNTIQNGSK